MAGVELLERSRPLGEMHAALRVVLRTGRGRVALVSGEAGIGKTSLLRSFCAEVPAPARVLWASCEPLFTPRPLGAILDLAASLGGQLAGLVSVPATPYDVATSLLRRLADVPSVLVVEDVHWADEATLDVLRVVARRLSGIPSLLVLTYRDDALDEAHPLRVVLGDLPGGDRTVRLELSCLSQRAVAELGGGVDAAALYRLTGGNPFYVTEVLAAGADRVPRSVRDAVLARAARLGPAARDLLAALAVIPGPAERWLLAALAAGVLDSLDECVRSGMVLLEGDRIQFRHEITRRAVERSLPPVRLAALHRAAITALSGPGGRDPGGSDPDLTRLAHHATALGDASAVLRHVPAAAARAAAAGARREATGLYAQAMRFADALAPVKRVELLEGFAGAAYFTGETRAAVVALRAAAAIHAGLGDQMRQGDALRRCGLHLWKDGAFAEAGPLLAEAVALLERAGPPGPALARAYGVSALVLASLGEDERAEQASGRARVLAERLDCTDALADALNVTGMMRLRAGGLDGLDLLDRARELSERAGDELGVARAWLHPALLLAARRQWALVERYSGPGREYCAQRGLDRWHGEFTALVARTALARGRWDEAARAAGEILAAPAERFVDVRVTALLVLGRARMRHGDTDWRPLIDEAARLVAEGPFTLAALDIAAARAEAAWLGGAAPARIGAELAGVVAGGLTAVRWLAGEVGAWQHRAGIDCGDPVAFAEPYRLEVTGDPDAAARWWLDRGCPYDAALALAFAGDAGAVGDAGDMAVLRRALDLLRGAGAHPAAAVVARMLRARGVPGVPRGPRAATAASPAGLTIRETEVLRLMAAGLSNPEIAARLVLSSRTVDNHVSSILRKMGVPNRAAASAKLSAFSA